MHKLLERQLKKYLPGYPEIHPDMEKLFEVISESYEHYDNDRLLVSNAMKESSNELSTKRQQLKKLYDQQTIVIDALRQAVLKLLPDHNFHLEDDLLKIADVLREIIEEKTRAENLREQSEQRLRNILDNLNLGMVEYDMSGKLTLVQSNFAAMFGYTPDELVGNHAEFFRLTEAGVSELGPSYPFLLHNHVFEASMRNKSGETFWLLCTTTPVFDDHGCQNGGVMVVFDISSRKRQENELRHARRAAEAGLEVRKTILSNVSHELRTPVNAIVGMTALLAATELDDNQRDFVNTLQFSSEGLLVLIDDLLDISRIESGKIELEHIPFALENILNSLSKSLGLKAREKGLRFDYYHDPELNPFLYGDPHRISQVLMNLISNAIKFTEHGSIVVNATLIENGDQDQELMISVVDTGIGIATNRLNAIFQEFSQEDASTTRRFGGTGLGLTISRKIVELMGGKLQVKSEKNVGSEFYFSLKLKKSDAPELRVDQFNPDLSGVKILLVEDNAVNQYLASTLLRTWSAEVVICGNGALALEVLEKEKFDIILMDLQMPVKDGFQTTEEIRKERGDQIPIIALTANSLRGEQEACMSHGMNDYITKPFQPQQLYNRIISLIRKPAGEIRA